MLIELCAYLFHSFRNRDYLPLLFFLVKYLLTLYLHELGFEKVKFWNELANLALNQSKLLTVLGSLLLYLFFGGSDILQTSIELFQGLYIML